MVGPDFGYYPNASKTHLVVVKPELVNKAKRMFKNTDVQISTNGQRHLGAAMGTQEFIETYGAQKIAKWVNEIESLTAIARTHPHAPYTAFVYWKVVILHCKNKLVVLTKEWLPWLQTNWRDSGC